MSLGVIGRLPRPELDEFVFLPVFEELEDPEVLPVL
jgi:hypothetical protein